PHGVDGSRRKFGAARVTSGNTGILTSSGNKARIGKCLRMLAMERLRPDLECGGLPPLWLAFYNRSKKPKRWQATALQISATGDRLADAAEQRAEQVVLRIAVPEVLPIPLGKGDATRLAAMRVPRAQRFQV